MAQYRATKSSIINNGRNVITKAVAKSGLLVALSIDAPSFHEAIKPHGMQAIAATISARRYFAPNISTPLIYDRIAVCYYAKEGFSLTIYGVPPHFT